MLSSILLLVITSLICSIPFGVIYAKVFCNIDIQKEGSKNIGATNIARVCGKQWGLLTLCSDIAKGSLPVLYASYAGYSSCFISLIAIVAVLSHAYSPFLHFKGGKSVATTIGIWIILAPIPLLWAVAICIFTIWRSHYVSAGSLSLVLSLPILLLFFREYKFVPLALFLLIFIFIRHKDNIERITNGTENKWNRT